MFDPWESPMALGAGSFGGIGSPVELIGCGLDDTGASTTLSRAVALGITLVDTAHSYAGGAADRMVGAWLAADPTRPAQIAVVAKLGILPGPAGLHLDLSPESVRRCAAETRERLGLDRVAVVMSHGFDERTPVDETLGTFAELIDAGHAEHYGVSNVELAELEAVLDTADRLGLPPPRLVENEYNLIRRGDEHALLPVCAERGIGFLAYSPLAGGLLTGKYRAGEPPPPSSRFGLRGDDQLERLTRKIESALWQLTAFAAEVELSLPALALAWVAAQPGVRPIVGVSKPEHLTAAEQALARPLSPSEAAFVADLFNERTS